MKIDGLIWLREIVDKLAWKHQVDPEEVEEVPNNQPKIRFVEKGERKGEDVYMAKNKVKTLPELNSIDDLVAFFATHDMGDYWEQMPEADFEVKIKRRKHLIALEEDVVTKVTQIAKAKRVSSEALINTWLKEKLRRAG